MARNECKGGADFESTGIANGAREAAEATEAVGADRRPGTAARYLYMAGAVATAVLLIALAAV